MAPKGSGKWKGNATAGAKMATSGLNRRLSLDRDCIQGFFSEHICGLWRIYNVCSVMDGRAWELIYDKVIPDPVTTRHFSHFQRMWPHCRSRCSPSREWWAVFCSPMGPMFDNARHEMKNWRWDNPGAFRDQGDRSNPVRTISGKVRRTRELFFWYSSDDLRAKIEPRSCRQYKSSDFLAFRLLNWNEIIDQDDDDETRLDPGAPSNWSSRHGDGNGNDHGEGEEQMQRGEIGTWTGKGTKDVKGNGKGTGKGKGKGKATAEGKRKGKGNRKGKGILEETPGWDDISRAVAMQLQKTMYEEDSDMEGQLAQVYLQRKASAAAMSISSDDDTDSTEESDGEYDSEPDSDVDMCMEDDVDAPYGVYFDGDGDIERDGDDEEEDEEEEDAEGKDEKEEDEDDEEDKDDKEDEDEDDNKEPRTIGHGEMVDTSADHVDTIVDDMPIVLPELVQEMREHTSRWQPPAPTPRPQSQEPRQWPRTPRDSSPRWARVSGACDVVKTTPGGAFSVRSWGSRNNLRCGCGSAPAWWIGRWWQSPCCPSPRCPTPCGAPRWLGRWAVNQSLNCRGGDGCCVWVRVGFLSCWFPLFWLMYLRHWLLHASRGFWIAQGLFHVWVLYWLYFVHSNRGHCVCSVFATPGM